jgi:hypothetical protein
MNSAFNDEDEYLESLKRITSSKHRLRRGSSAGAGEMPPAADAYNQNNSNNNNNNKENKDNRDNNSVDEKRTTSNGKKKGSRSKRRNRELDEDLGPRELIVPIPTPKTFMATKAIEDRSSEVTAVTAAKGRAAVRMNAFGAPAENGWTGGGSAQGTARTEESEDENAGVVTGAAAANAGGGSVAGTARTADGDSDVAVEVENKEMTRVLNLIDDTYYNSVYEGYDNVFFF